MKLIIGVHANKLFLFPFCTYSIMENFGLLKNSFFFLMKVWMLHNPHPTFPFLTYLGWDLSFLFCL